MVDEEGHGHGDTLGGINVDGSMIMDDEDRERNAK